MGELQTRNMEIVRNVHEQVNLRNLEVFDETLAPGYVRHCQAMPPGAQELRGSEPLKVFVAEHLEAFPDWLEHVDFMFADGDMVSYVTTGTGTQTGPMGPFPATGKQVELSSVIIQRLEDGKVAETWISWDNVSFLTQLGHFPPNQE